MFQVFPDFLTAEECARLRTLSASGAFTTGDKTVRGDLRSTKQNQEFAGDRRAIDEIMRQAVGRCRPLQDFLMPKAMKPAILSRYVEGMTYGRHLDTPLLFAGNTIRSDMSMTVFINPPESYDGGELVMETDYGLHSVKLPVGHAVSYDTESYHWVEPVSRGERLALVTWFQSLVADPGCRRALWELRQAFNEIAPREPEAESTRLVQKVLNNLTRRWVQP